jgi:polysaccharide deacetylase family protein (PEP-CTERM system associated)
LRGRFLEVRQTNRLTRIAKMLNVLTVDVEEYFHPSEVQRSAPVSSWSAYPSRVESQVKATLDLLSRHNVKSTFFVLGWIAEQHPHVVRQIVAAGHEIGCHSYAHRLVFDLTPAEFACDTKRAIKAIEDACGVTPRSYRAPSYSITRRSMWALDILAECGITHDSSIYPVNHDRYGISGFPRHTHVLNTLAGPLVEVPVATVQLSGQRVSPVGGGAYLRLLPYRYTGAGIRRLNQVENEPACIYFHPWELDDKQPRMTKGVLARLRTYNGLRTMARKIDRLLTEFRFGRIMDVYPLQKFVPENALPLCATAG